MTELAYMTHADWAQDGTGMEEQGRRIREWLDGEPYIFVDLALDKRGKKTPTDSMFADSVAPAGAQRITVGLSEFLEYSRPGDGYFDHALVVIYPFEERECELLREVIAQARIKRVFVIVWSAFYLVRDMLDGLGAVNLFDGSRVAQPDPLQVAAAEAMVAEEYNGLESGRGKDAVIQLLRAFREEGYLLDETWIHALFAAGGSYRSAQTLARFLKEMNDGVKHRIQARFVPDIVRVLRAQIARDATEPTR